MSRIDADDTTPTAPTAPKTLLADVDTQRSAGEVTRVSLNLASTSDVAAPAKPLPTVVQPAGFDGATLSSASMNVSDGPEIILPSLIPSAQPEAASQPETEQLVTVDNGFSDMRSVSASRVNVRGGPGTQYGVVDNLTRGTQVEILQDPGNGWVKLRPIEGGAEGWMADFLLTSG
ncbi:SH3 domain-containing protein [Photobacterium sp. TY 1-4]|uniref:SH3 domain-containing protein n=2 Tax=Pseudosulfitobacter koreensis TaxID=2968472 RepID=A0ABT1YVK0_9RHOB|nr:SH3 domain-containing protein [Pseudosulfitobacter koreense]